MLEGQKKFYEYILSCTKDDKLDEVKKILEESFQRQKDKTFDLNFLNSFHNKMKDVIKEEKMEEVFSILSKFGKNHIS